MLACRSSLLRRSLRPFYRFYSSPVVEVPPPINEPTLSFAPGSEERAGVKKALNDLQGKVEEIPCVVGGREVLTGNIQEQVSPYDHQRVIARYHYADKDVINEAIGCALEAKKQWEDTPYEHRAAVILRMAELISTKYRYEVLATTMLGQAKTAFQAEIDSTCETIDFFRFAVKQGLQLQGQPAVHSPCVWNRMEYRPLEGFIASISPFNFTAIGANLGATPTLMGNSTLWKPSDTAMLSNWTMFKIFREAGMPPGVVNFIPAPGPLFGDTVTDSPDLAGISFTGSSATFKHLWKLAGAKLDTFKTFPRIVGECGGKNYHFVHPSADIDNVVFCSVRGAFEFSGQKCSATSRMYVPESKWDEIRDKMIAITKQMKIGSPEDFSTFTSAVIDARSFEKISGYLDFAKSSDEVTVLVGGTADDSVGYFVQPTIFQTTNPKNKLMQEEIFGPVLTVYVYPDSQVEEMLEVVNSTSVYGLTGAVFSNDRYFIQRAMSVLRHSAGNFYINDKSTGSVVGQQPFGGARGSGTNDKAGSGLYLQKWVSPITIKETLTPCTEWSYPSVDP